MCTHSGLIRADSRGERAYEKRARKRGEERDGAEKPDRESRGGAERVIKEQMRSLKFKVKCWQNGDLLLHSLPSCKMDDLYGTLPHS